MPTTPRKTGNKGDNTTPLYRRDKESESAHRALLLWAMQNPSRRRVIMVSRAMGRSAPTVHEFKNKWDWVERVSSLTADTEAQALYRRLYIPKIGTKEIEQIQSNIVTPISKVGTLPKGVGEIAERVIHKTQKKGDPNKEMRKKHIALIDAAIGYIAQGIKNGEVKPTMRDIPTLIQFRNQLLGKQDNQNSGFVTESVRVRLAKETGGDIVDAMIEDCEELTLILKSLKYQSGTKSDSIDINQTS